MIEYGYSSLDDSHYGIMRWTPAGCAPGENDRTIYFDMDGTIANLYGVSNWQTDLDNWSSRPYREAEPIYDPEELDDFTTAARAAGWRIGIISWLSRNSSPEYDDQVIAAKIDWLLSYFPDLDEIVLAPYGTPKHELIDPIEAILIDDEPPNRFEWESSGPYRRAYPVEDIPALTELLSEASTQIDKEALFDLKDDEAVTLEDLKYAVEQKFAAASWQYGFELPAVGFAYDPYADEWFFSIGVPYERDDGETYAEGVFIVDPDDVTADEQNQVIEKTDRIIFNMLRD